MQEIRFVNLTWWENIKSGSKLDRECYGVVAKFSQSLNGGRLRDFFIFYMENYMQDYGKVGGAG